MIQSHYLSLITVLAALAAAPLSAQERPRMISETELDTSIERQKRQALSRMKSELRAEVRDPARAEAALIELYECLGRDPSRLADTDKESPREEAPARRGVPHSFRFPSVDAGLLTGLRLR